MNAKPKGGRPQKYEGEKPVRIGAMVRPRYKEMLETLARTRNCTLGEAMEYCIATISNDTRLSNGITLYDAVVPDDEIKIEIAKSRRDMSVVKNPTDEIVNSVDELDRNIKKFWSLPPAISSSVDTYLYQVATDLGSSIFLFYERDAFKDIVTECWKRGYRHSDVSHMFKGELLEYLDTASATSPLKEMSEIIKTPSP